MSNNYFISFLIMRVKTLNDTHWKTTIIYSKVLYLILNVQVSIQNFYFKLLNRKTHILII